VDFVPAVVVLVVPTVLGLKPASLTWPRVDVQETMTVKWQDGHITVRGQQLVTNILVMLATVGDRILIQNLLRFYTLAE
jgi:hypothetical protein